MVLIGIGGFTGFSILVSSILPMFGIFQLTNLDSPSSLVFVLFTAFAVFKYRFLGTKVILAHLLVIVMIIFFAIEIFYFGTSAWHLFFRVIFFLVFFVMGTLLVEAVVVDVRRKEELELANAKLKQLDNAKSEFISIASHQLRTPLTAIKGFTDLILEGHFGKLNKSMEEVVDEISQNNQRLTSLVSDLLNVSRIESGKINLNFEKIDIVEICREIANTFIFKAKEKKLHFKFKKPDDLIPKIHLDKKTITEAISNVIDNALKYTFEGRVDMEIKNNPDGVAIVISDTGIGISKEQMSKVFSKFSRGTNALKYDISGTGLGLFVARSMTELNGGSIWGYSSGEGKGSKFTIKIPVR